MKYHINMGIYAKINMHVSHIVISLSVPLSFFFSIVHFSLYESWCLLDSKTVPSVTFFYSILFYIFGLAQL